MYFAEEMRSKGNFCTETAEVRRIITYNGIKEDEYGDGYSINFITENLTDKKIIVQYEDASLNDFMFYAVYSANLAPNKKSKDEIDISVCLCG